MKKILLVLVSLLALINSTCFASDEKFREFQTKFKNASPLKLADLPQLNEAKPTFTTICAYPDGRISTWENEIGPVQLNNVWDTEDGYESIMFFGHTSKRQLDIDYWRTYIKEGNFSMISNSPLALKHGDHSFEVRRLGKSDFVIKEKVESEDLLVFWLVEKNK